MVKKRPHFWLSQVSKIFGERYCDCCLTVVATACSLQYSAKFQTGILHFVQDESAWDWDKQQWTKIIGTRWKENGYRFPYRKMLMNIFIFSRTIKQTCRVIHALPDESRPCLKRFPKIQLYSPSWICRVETSNNQHS